MEVYYIILIIILFVLAFSDLIIGVSNDAVNFLNSAIGSKTAPFNTIIIFAGLGILFGAIFSSGMMEVARKGIFHPEHFYFSEIMLVFLAVMLTDIILLDLFNTFGMPTSTTVSIVFELLGAAVAMSLIKIYMNPDALSIGEYINTQKALAIIGGILLSVAVSILAGAFIQYLVRLVFTFDYEETFKKFGAIWGSISFTGIIYFILIKGIKDASFMTSEVKHLIQDQWLLIIGISFVVFYFMFLILQKVFKLNILRIIVLVGTFALATAFAGNDLVNFIGVPMAAYNSFQFWVASNAAPEAFSMASLAAKVPTETWMLIASGIVMVLTLKFSKKARSVTETEVNLGRQDEGYERFGSNAFARVLVQLVMNTHKSLSSLVPKKLNKAIIARFKPVTYAHDTSVPPPQFDMLRASVNIMMAAIVISLGTSLKLPLSTTYVTFMVAMGTSLSDRAWGRESAVYRISGVLAVVGGWFFTALFAFTLSFIILSIIYFGGKIAIAIILIAAGYFLFQTHFLYKKREQNKQKLLQEAQLIGKVDTIKIKESSQKIITQFLSAYNDIINRGISTLSVENKKGLRLTYADYLKLNKMTRDKKDQVHKLIDNLSNDSFEAEYFYVQVLDYIREVNNNVEDLIKPALDHIENSHKPLIQSQIEDLNNLTHVLHIYINNLIQIVKKESIIDIQSLYTERDRFLKLLRSAKKEQIKRIKAHEVGTRNSMLYFALLIEMKNISIFSLSVIKSHLQIVAIQEGKNVDDDADLSY